MKAINFTFSQKEITKLSHGKNNGLLALLINIVLLIKVEPFTRLTVVIGNVLYSVGTRIEIIIPIN